MWSEVSSLRSQHNDRDQHETPIFDHNKKSDSLCSLDYLVLRPLNQAHCPPGAAVVIGRTVVFAVAFGHKKIVSPSNTKEGGDAVVGGEGAEYAASLMSNLRCSLPDKISTL